MYNLVYHTSHTFQTLNQGSAVAVALVFGGFLFQQPTVASTHKKISHYICRLQLEVAVEKVKSLIFLVNRSQSHF